MAKLHYRIVPHDGGWAYRLGDVFSERFPRREDALAAARRVVEEQRTPGEPAEIQYEDEHGHWHTEHSDGNDHPDVDVVE